jgi:hypothetical protein
LSVAAFYGNRHGRGSVRNLVGLRTSQHPVESARSKPSPWRRIASLRKAL